MQVRFLQSYQRGTTQGAANGGRGAVSDDLEAGKGAGVGDAGGEQASVVFRVLRFPPKNGLLLLLLVEAWL